MTALLVALTIVEIALVLAVLVYYLARIAGSLRRTAPVLGKVAFGVRAIETQTSAIGPSVHVINEQLAGIADAFEELTARADTAARPAPTSRGR